MFIAIAYHVYKQMLRAKEKISLNAVFTIRKYEVVKLIFLDM